MAQSFIGKPISLVSHSDVRYRGILAGIDPHASTIELSNVYSMGTESRRPPHQFIAPSTAPYSFIIFRASEVKDLSVDEQAAVPQQQQHNVTDDPAVIGVSAPAPKQTYPSYTAAAASGVPPAQQPPQQAYPPQQAQPSPSGPAPQQPTQQQQQQGTRGGPQGRRPNPVHTAAASLETVERAIGDLRVNGGANAAPHHAHTGRGGRRGGQRGGRSGGGGAEVEHIKVPTTDFDFQGSNAKFAKAPHSPAVVSETTEDGSDEDSETEKKPMEKEQPAYNPQKSFFDQLSSSSAAAPPAGSGERSGRGGGGGGRRGGGGGGMGRNRREEEREKNVATFGEPGGVGLLGPGGYVAGWGGYGRRGGRRGAGRGSGRGGANNGQAAVQTR